MSESENTALLQRQSADSPRDDSVVIRVSDSLPASAWLIAVIEGCERFAYYGVSGPLQNYIQNSRGDPLRPGLIGLGQANATRLNLAFLTCSYFTPVVGAVLADQFWGRYKTILIASLSYMLGLCILASSAAAFADDQHLSLAALIFAMLFIAIGAGGIKANVGPWVAEQYQESDSRKLDTLKDGSRVVVDYDKTIQSIFMYYLLFVQLGGFSALLTTELERRYGFSIAFLTPLCAFAIGLGLLILGKKFFVVHQPDGSTLLKAFAVFRLASQNAWNLEAAKASYQERQTCPRPISWDDAFVDELRQVTRAWKIFAFYPFYFLALSQMFTNFVSQAATMDTHGTPNDIWFNSETLSVVLLIPLLNNIIFPALNRNGIAMEPTTRITWGFVLMSSAMAYAAVIQAIIYRAPPCYQYPLQCQGGKVPNQVHVALQIPAYFLMGASEVLTISSGYQYAFTQAPQSMKSIIMASFLITVTGGTLLGIAITPLTEDPRLTWMYSGLSLMCFVVGVTFWFFFSKDYRATAVMNKIDFYDGTGSVDGDSEARP